MNRDPLGCVAERLEGRFLLAASSVVGPYVPVPMPPEDAVAGAPIWQRIAGLEGVDPSGFGRRMPHAVIRWGDGRGRNVVPAEVVGTRLLADAPARPHAYRRAGTYTARILFRLGGRVLGRVVEDIVVHPTSPGGLVLEATAGQPFAGPVGTFNAGFPGGPIIDWGDGSNSDGTLESLGNASWRVSGSHTYRRPGEYRIVVSVSLNPPPHSRAVSTFAPVIYSMIIVHRA